MFKNKIRIYAARSMTGRVKEEVVNEAVTQKMLMENEGLTVLCPVVAEGVQPTKQVLLSSKKAMDQYWPRDKEMIRESNLVFDLSPDRNSEGVKHELGYARYCLWKPIVRVFPKNQLPVKSSVAFYEDDYICDNLEDAISYAKEVHGTPGKRFKWKMQILNRCLLKAIKVKLMWLVDWV